MSFFFPLTKTCSLNLPCLIYFDSNEKQKPNDLSLFSKEVLLAMCFLSVYEKRILGMAGHKIDSERKKKKKVATNQHICNSHCMLFFSVATMSNALNQYLR